VAAAEGPKTPGYPNKMLLQEPPPKHTHCRRYLNDRSGSVVGRHMAFIAFGEGVGFRVRQSKVFGTWFSFWPGNTPRHRWLPLMKRPKGMTVHLTECSVGCLCGGPGPPRRRCRCFGCTTTPAHAPVGQPSAPSFPAFCSFRRSVHNSRLRPWLTDPRVPNRLRFFFY